jgi:hypothetical protein
VRHMDTVDKIVGVYLAGVCSHAFRYKGELFRPKLLIVSPLLLRGHTCPGGCGACCGSFSLDFIPGDTVTDGAAARIVMIDDRPVRLMSDRQADVPDRWCRHLDRMSGRCTVHAQRPMACDFELIRFLIYETKVLLIQKQYGRAWSMKRLDEGLGALCTMLPPTPQRIADVTRKLERLQSWAAHFGIETRIERILSWIEAGDHARPLRLPPPREDREACLAVGATG